jgi:thiol:disulfide interchange protein
MHRIDTLHMKFPFVISATTSPIKHSLKRSLGRAFTAAMALVSISGFQPLEAQIFDPVDWAFSLYESETESSIEGHTTIDLVIHASVDKGWHIYSQHLDQLDGPLPTYFEIAPPEGIALDGEVNECSPEIAFDPNFNMDLKFFGEEVYWHQRVVVPYAGVFEAQAANDTLAGYLNFMVCNDIRCLPPEDVEIEIALSDLQPGSARPDYCTLTETSSHGSHSDDTDGGDATHKDESSSDDNKESIWGVFILGMLLGFAALLTPCVFPMIPMTVSFFTKQSKTRSQGLRNAGLYGFFIIVIYTGLGLAVTAVFGVDVMNRISTDPYFNIFLFLLLIVFGASFLGAFEIQLPSSWANKADIAADRGGLLGIFFMAATLAIVSFSCTGPLIGSALAGAATGSFAAPTAVMFGFSLALAIPFMFFSAFPGWLNSLPQSGGWLNSVKVVLGMVEIGFAFKFLSNADLVWQTGLLERELFIAIWIGVAFLTAFYLFGWLTLPHDSKTERISVSRFSFGMIFFTFGIYLIPGMWGAPVNLISGFPPPLTYKEWKEVDVEPQFKDYHKGLQEARRTGKPMLLDFTGHACVNCRKMEEQVWTNADVASILNEEVILVSLYVDDRRDLPESLHRVEEYGGKTFNIKTIGKQWAYLQASEFNTNSQPFYVMIDHDENQVGESVGYDPDPDLFLDFLEDSQTSFNASKH